ncbi:MAG: hypothetical protein LAT55_07500 [Opitutales bacterium]|nr:hypothetical protein [Opitutales bacterium]
MSKVAPYEWDSEGNLQINDAQLGKGWWNYLFNDQAQLKIDPYGQGQSWSREPRINAWGRGRRECWIRFANGRTWSPSGWPQRHPEASWACRHAPMWTRIESRLGDLEVHWRVFLPREGPHEIWTVRLINHGSSPLALALTHCLFQPTAGFMGSRSNWDAERRLLWRHDFPHHAGWDEYEPLSKLANYLYLRPLTDPHSWAVSDPDYFGSAMPAEVPDGVLQGFPSREAALDPSCAATQNELTLGGGESKAYHFIAGAAVSLDQAAGACALLKDDQAIEDALAERVEEWEETEKRLWIETPDPQINRYVNRWAKKEIVWMSRLWRNGITTPWRNELQDSMGYSLFDEPQARPFLDTVTAAQTKDGHLKVWNTRPGEKPNHPLVNYRHNDGSIWLLICQCMALRQSGDRTLMERPIAWGDGREARLLDHLSAALEESAADRGDHGLVSMHDGDWTDPLNGPGRLGRGGSGWATMALAYGARLLQPLAITAGDESLARRCLELHAELTRTVQKQLWAEDRFAYAIDDEGKRFGDQADDRVWLNAQSWGILSGIATREQIPLIRKTVDSRLMTPCGPVLIDPMFTGWDPQVGRLSLKVPGSTENGSVYCHAAAFWAAALAEIGAADEALDILKRVLPEHPENPCEECGQPPIWQHNAWFGDRNSPHFGRTSGTLGTGTVPWAVLTIVEKLLGVEASLEGLRVGGALPQGWAGSKVTRWFGGESETVVRS